MSFFLSAPQSDAVSGLYHAHHGWLYAWLRKKLNCSHNAADIAHDTFVRVMERLATIDEAQKKIDGLTVNVVSLQELLGD